MSGSKKEKYFKCIDNYRVLPDGKTFRIEAGPNGEPKEIYISNFALIPEKIIIKRKDSHSEPIYNYEYGVFYKGEFHRKVTLDRETILKGRLAKYGVNGSRVFTGLRNNEEFSNMTLALLDDEAIETENVLMLMGMVRHEDSRLIFVNQGFNIDSNGKNTEIVSELPTNFDRMGFVDIDTHDRGKWIKELENICPDEVTIPTVSYATGSVTNFMHYENDNEDNSLFYLLGESQAGKSTYAKFWQSLFGRYPHADTAPISFSQCSPNAMKTLLQYVNFALVVVDDIRLNDVVKDREKYKEILKELTETIGNRAAKQILDEASNLKDPRISHASVMLTGENDLELSQAANARTTVIEIKKEYDIRNRSDLIQDHLEEVNGIGQDFIQYFIQNYDKINKQYRDRMKFFSGLIPKGGNERVRNNISHYMFNYWLWDLYQLDKGYISDDEFVERENKMIVVMQDLAIKQNNRIADVSVTRQFLTHIKESIDSGRHYYDLLINGETKPETRFSRRQSSTSTCIAHLDRKEGTLNLIKAEAIKAAEEYGTLPVAGTVLWKMLRDERLIIPGEKRGNEYRPDRKVKVNGEYKRCISVKLSAFDESFEIDDGGDTYEE